MKRLILSPDVFLWRSNDQCLIYNSLARKGFVMQLDESLLGLVSHLQNPEALYSIILDSNLLASQNVTHFITRVLEERCGEVVEDDPDITLPMMPILKIQDDCTYFKWRYEQGVTGDTIDNIHNIVINVGSEFGDDVIAKQTVYPVKKSDKRLNLKDVTKFVRNVKSSVYLSEISIVGDVDVLLEDNFIERIKTISPIRFYINVEFLQKNINLIETLNNYGSLTLLVRASKVTDSVIDFLILNRDNIDNVTLLFETMNEYEELEQLFMKTPIENSFEFIPIFNGTNANFMHEILDFDIAELLTDGPDKRVVFLNQTLNPYDFGKLYILPSGDVFSNMCSEAMGRINDLPSVLLIQEFLSHKSWLKTRDSSACGSCIFRYLCPSISNYEQLMNTLFCNLK